MGKCVPVRFRTCPRVRDAEVDIQDNIRPSPGPDQTLNCMVLSVSIVELTLTHRTSRMEKHTQDTPAGPHADILTSCK